MNSTTQVPPDEQSSENALICEKLFGFTKHCDEPGCNDWRTADGIRVWNSPAFTTWAEAGLILDALAAAGHDYMWRHDSLDRWHPYQFEINKRFTGRADNGPAAIRTAALLFIRSLP